MRYLVGLIVAVLIAAGAGQARAQEVERIAAIVNDEVVSVYDLQSRMRMVMVSAGLQPSPELTKRLMPQVLRQLIDERLRMQEAKRRSIFITQRDMNTAIATLEKQNHLQPGTFDQFLARQGIPKDTVMQQVRAELAWYKLINQRIAPRISVGPDEVQEVLNRMKAQQGQSEYRLAEIVLSVDKPEAVPEVRRTAERLVEQLRGGAQFAAVARQFSQSPSASVGGDLGWIPEVALSEDLRKVVPTLKEGQVSGPFTMLNGVDILMLIEKRRMLAADPDQATVKLDRVLLPLPADPSPAAVKSQMDLASTLGQSVKSCTDLGRAAKEAGVSGPFELGQFKIADLSTAMRTVVRDLPVGKASAPRRDEHGISVFMVCERKDAPSGMPTAAEIERQLRGERIENAARRYMRDLRFAAVVDVRV
jgi:peptidyl-prolyl cis-trans isomerase SurA